MKKTITFLVALIAIYGGSHRAAAQGPPAPTFPAIVVFAENAILDQFAAAYRPDQRANANPEAWGYLNRGVAWYVQALERTHGFSADHVYSAALRGFAARLNPRQLQDLQNDANVAYIEPDGVASIVAQTLPWGIDRIDADLSSTLAGNGSGTITGVNAYIIDTGIDASHPDLNVGGGNVNFAGGPNTDCNGHGTHVAGTVAAKDNTSDVVGVAPGVRLTGVKVLGCGGSGTWSGVIKGIDWVTANAVKPAIANMSLGGGANTSVDDAVRRSAAAGVFYSIAAGNEGADACNSSPARAGKGTPGTENGIVTVAATDSGNNEASWSNYGNCVDIWAPGVSILSTRKGGGTTTMSGTSMASPHVGGSGALYLSTHTSATPGGVEAALKTAAATPGTTGKGGAAIKLVNVGTF